MTYQAIRRFYEEPVETTATALSIPLRYANQLEAGGDAYTEYLTARLNLGLTTDPTLCGPIEVIRGSFIVDYYGPKGIGSARAQFVMQQIATALCSQVYTSPHNVAGFDVKGTMTGLNGPSFTPLDNTPYFFATLSTGIVARILGSAPTGSIRSLHTRVGGVLAEEGDYAIDELADVSAATPSGGDVLVWDGTNWSSSPSIDAKEY